MSPRFNRLGKREELWRRLCLRSEAKSRILNPEPTIPGPQMTQRAVAQAEFEVRDGTVYPVERTKSQTLCPQQGMACSCNGPARLGLYKQSTVSFRARMVARHVPTPSSKTFLDDGAQQERQVMSSSCFCLLTERRTPLVSGSGCTFATHFHAKDSAELD